MALKSTFGVSLVVLVELIVVSLLSWSVVLALALDPDTEVCWGHAQLMCPFCMHRKQCPSLMRCVFSLSVMVALAQTRPGIVSIAFGSFLVKTCFHCWGVRFLLPPKSPFDSFLEGNLGRMRRLLWLSLVGKYMKGKARADRPAISEGEH